jgi:hypothetical protein
VNGLQWFLSLFIFCLGVFMPHKRSLQGNILQRQREQDFKAIKVQRKVAWQYIRETEFRDSLIGETVCRTDINSITDMLAKLFGQPESEAVPNVEPGLVLIGPSKEFNFDA